MKKMGRTGIRIAVFAFIAAAAVGLAACGNSSISETGFNAAADGLGLRGYDAVAYFAVNSAVKGNAQFEYVWNGVKWHFSSEENRKAFQQNPEKYAPQYGGYCAYAVSKNYTADGDPEAWKIVDGKLYLNYNKEVQATWEKDQAERIVNADKNWQELKAKSGISKS